MHWQVTDAHPSNQSGHDPFRFHHGFIRRHGEMQVVLVDAPECPQVRAERRARPLAGVAMDLVRRDT
jgi:hypothetical protein